VDFGYVGLTPDTNRKKRKTWIFNMKLSYSRLDYYEKVFNQRVETFIQCHINAFEYFGGIPEYVKIDNLKAAVLQANFYEPVYQAMYKNFADYYDFKIMPCRIYSPNDKGKVESGIKYVKGNFFCGRVFKDGNDTDRQLKNWMENKCNARVHGTTRKIPKEIFISEEKSKLKKLPLERFKFSKVGSRIVYHDCHVFIDYNYYSVPFEYVGKEVDIEITKNTVKIFYGNKEISVHSIIEGRGNFSTINSHYPKYKVFSDTEYQEKYQVKMAQIGPFSEQIFFRIIQENPNDWNRTVQGIISLVKSFSKNIVELSCKRALAYSAHKYQTIKNICNNGSYLMPAEFSFEEDDNHEYSQN